MAAYQEETWEFDADGDPSRMHREEHTFEGGTARTRHVTQDFSKQNTMEILKELLPAFAQFQSRKLELQHQERQNLREHQVQQHYAMLAEQRLKLEMQQEANQQQERNRQYQLEQRKQSLEERKAALEQYQARLEERRLQIDSQRIAQEDRASQRQQQLEYDRLAEEQRKAQKAEQQYDVKLRLLYKIASMAFDPAVSAEKRQAIQKVLSDNGIETSQLIPSEGGASHGEHE